MLKARNPYIKFFPSDYLSDLRLRLETFEVQGFWLNLMCIMQKEGDPFGHLALNGLAISCENLGVLLGKNDVKKIEVLLEHVAKAKLFDVTPEGILFSRRLLREEKLRNVRSRAGKKGGEATQSSVLLKQSLQAKRGNGNSNGNGNEKSFEKESKPESEIQEWALEIVYEWNAWRKARGLGADAATAPKGQGIKNLIKLTKSKDKYPREQLARCVTRYLEHDANSECMFGFANFWGQKQWFHKFLADDWQPPVGTGKQQSSSIHDLDLTSSEGRVHD